MLGIGRAARCHGVAVPKGTRGKIGREIRREGEDQPHKVMKRGSMQDAGEFMEEGEAVPRRRCCWFLPMLTVTQGPPQRGHFLKSATYKNPAMQLIR